MTVANREKIIRAIGLIEGVGCCVNRDASSGLEIACEYLNEVLNSDLIVDDLVPARQEVENDA